MKKKIPLGVKIISILALVGAVFFVLLAFVFGLSAIYAIQHVTELENSVTADELAVLGSVAVIAPLFGLFALFFLVAGVIGLLVGFTFWKGKNWGRILLLVFSLVSIVSSLVGLFTYSFTSLNVLIFFVKVAVVVLLVWYLRTKEVRKYFGAKGF